MIPNSTVHILWVLFTFEFTLSRFCVCVVFKGGLLVVGKCFLNFFITHKTYSTLKGTTLYNM